MRPRNRFEREVAASNVKLSAISPKAVEWAVRNTVKHIAFRTSGHKCTCGDCGHKFDYKGKGRYIRCPQCRHKLEVTDTLARKRKESAYFSTIGRVDGFHVQRVFLLTAVTRKGRKLDTWQTEVCRLWLNTDGKAAVTSRARALGHYMDCFNWFSGIELRNMTNVHWVISDCFVYPHYSTTRELRRNGMRGRLPDCHPTRLAEALLMDCRIETMMKAKDFKAVAHFISHPFDLNRCWQPYKIAKRHRYEPEDYGLWCDTVSLIDKCGKDIHSVKYICPKDLKADHDRWLAKATRMEERRRDMERMVRAKRYEVDYYREKSCFFGIVLSDSDIEISVLDSIEAFRAEGEKMKHCVFECGYYAKSDSVILSAHDLSGKRIETVEFSIKQGKVIQSRGVCNSNTEFHDRIIKLVNDNAYRFLEAKPTS